MKLYPLQENHPDFIKSYSGKALDAITMDAIINGEVSEDDIRISKDVLILQAEVAAQDGKKQQAENLYRASELIDIPDDRILEIYNKLRPHRSSKEELQAIIDELNQTYKASATARLVEETLAVYQERDLLKETVE